MASLSRENELTKQRLRDANVQLARLTAAEALCVRLREEVRA